MRREIEEVCGTCKYNKRCYDGHCKSEFCCDNVDGAYYGVPTFFDDTCDDWEKKE